MYYYNVTCRVEESVMDKWLVWMQEEHIPEVMQTGCFISCNLMKLIEPIQDDGGIVYAIQYVYNTPKDFDNYLTQFATILKQKTMDLFGNTVLPFRTHLQIIQSFRP